MLFTNFIGHIQKYKKNKKFISNITQRKTQRKLQNDKFILYYALLAYDIVRIPIYIIDRGMNKKILMFFELLMYSIMKGSESV